VDIDNANAAFMVTNHLVSTGRRRVGHIAGIRGTAAAEDRLEGYRRAIDGLGLEPDELVVDGDFAGSGGYSGAKELVSRGVDAIFCANDATAEGALRALRELDLRIPEDVALAGFDDLDFAAHLDPPLTSIRQGVHQQGMEAARVLWQLIEEPEHGPIRILLPTELVIRQSTVGGSTAQ